MPAAKHATHFLLVRVARPAYRQRFVTPLETSALGDSKMTRKSTTQRSRHAFGNTGDGARHGRGAQPLMHQQGRETQAFGTVVRMPIGLDEDVCREMCEALNVILADAISL